MKTTMVFLVHYGRGGSTIAMLPFVKALSGTRCILVTRRNDEGAALFAGVVSETVVCRFPLTLNVTGMDRFLAPGDALMKWVKDAVKAPVALLLALHLMMRVRPSVIVAGDFPLLPVVAAAALLRIPAVVLVQTSVSVHPVKRWLVRSLLRTTDAVIGITEAHLDGIRSEAPGRTRFAVIPNTFRPDVSEDREGKLFLERIQIHGKKIVLFLGGVSRIKGTELFIRAASLICSERNDVLFVVAGPFHRAQTSPFGVGTSDIDADVNARVFSAADAPSVRDRFRFIGETPHIGALFQASEFHVVMNEYPHFSRPIIEGWAYRRPVVCVRDRFTEPLVTDGLNGLFVDPGNVDACRTAMTALLNDADRLRRMGEAGHDVYRQRFSPDSVTEPIRTIFSPYIDNQ